MMNSKQIKFYNYALLTFLILWSGGGFTYELFPYWMVYAFIIVGFVFFKCNYRFRSSNIKVLILLSFIFFFQLIKFNGAPISIISPILIIFVCLMASYQLRENFTFILVNIIYFFALVSVILWVINLVPIGHAFIDNLANSFPQLGWENLSNMESNSVNNARSVYLFTITDCEYIQRNSGPFWEPGRFTIFLTITLAINLFHENRKLFCFRNIILLFANFTTFSTTGYFALFVVILFYFIGNQKISTVNKLILVFFILAIGIFVWNLDFMADKINDQSNQKDLTYSRFGAIYYHMEQIVDSPIIGYGPYLSSSFLELAISPNGLTDLIRYFGVPVAIYFYILLYRSTTVFIGEECKIFRISVFISILILCFSQTITHSPFFYLLYFFGLNKTQYETA